MQTQYLRICWLSTHLFLSTRFKACVTESPLFLSRHIPGITGRSGESSILRILGEVCCSRQMGITAFREMSIECQNHHLCLTTNSSFDKQKSFTFHLAAGIFAGFSGRCVLRDASRSLAAFCTIRQGMADVIWVGSTNTGGGKNFGARNTGARTLLSS